MYDENIQRAIDFIEGNLDRNITIQQIAEEACYSVSHFYRLFTQAVGTPVWEFVRERRMEAAAQKLVESNDRIIDVAFDYQFDSQEAFTRAFSKLYGITPGKYRKEKRKLLLNDEINLTEKFFRFKGGSTMSSKLKIKEQRANFWKTFRVLLISGVPIMEIFDVAADAADDSLKTVLPNLKSAVQAGNRIHEAMQKAGFFSPLEISMITSGEMSGKLDDICENLAKIIMEIDLNFESKEVATDFKPWFQDDSEEANDVINSILADAIHKNASDVHLECFRDYLRLRFRIGGTLIDQPAPAKDMQNQLISRIKILANFRAFESLPQNGFIKAKIDDETIKIRVATMPTVFGEKITMRILHSENVIFDLERVVANPWILEGLKKATETGHGMILITGPTGSGKTTVLYSILSYLQKSGLDVNSIENPVEYFLDGINQIKLFPQFGMDFPSAIESILNLDPDVISVSEFPDLETLEALCKSAMSGHLVFVQLNTKSPEDSIKYLLEMGIDPYILSTSLSLIISQRLLRKLCPNCKKEISVAEVAVKGIEIKADTLGIPTCYEAVGCEKCNGKGYKGKAAIFEMMPITNTIENLILEGANREAIRNRAIADGMKIIQLDAIDKWKDGITSLKEIRRVTG